MSECLVALVAEQDRRDEEHMVRALRKAAVSELIHSVGDGQSAIDYLAGVGPYADRAAHPLPHFVFISDKLPGKSGLDVLQWVRQQPKLQRLPVMVLSAAADEAEKERVLALGANAHVIKPESVDDLAAKLKKFYVFWWPIAYSARAKAARTPLT